MRTPDIWVYSLADLFILSLHRIFLERLLVPGTLRGAERADSCGLSLLRRPSGIMLAGTHSAERRGPGLQAGMGRPRRARAAPCTSSSSISLYELLKKLRKSQKQYRIQLRKYRVNHMAWVARVGCIFLQTKKGLRVEGKEKKTNFPADEAVVWRQ